MATAIKAGRTDDVQGKLKTLQTPRSVCVLCVTKPESEPWISSMSRPNKGRPRQATREPTVPGRFHQLPSNYTFHTCMQ